MSYSMRFIFVIVAFLAGPAMAGQLDFYVVLRSAVDGWQSM
jgi:hypothetical protein